MYGMNSLRGKNVIIILQLIKKASFLVEWHLDRLLVYPGGALIIFLSAFSQSILKRRFKRIICQYNIYSHIYVSFIKNGG